MIFRLRVNGKFERSVSLCHVQIAHNPMLYVHRDKPNGSSTDSLVKKGQSVVWRAKLLLYKTSYSHGPIYQACFLPNDVSST